MDQELQTRMNNKVKECFRKGNKQFGAKAKLNSFSVSKRLTQRYGVAGWNEKDKWYIRVSYNAVINDPDYVIDEIIPHEVAHIISMWLHLNQLEYGDWGHGAGWKAIAQALGSSGDTNGKPRGFDYKADNGEVIRVTPEQHNELQNKFKVFRTKNGGRITAAGLIRKP